ncbi:MAG: hypothetical protein B7Z55_10065 [Planctomycetales bacterium 12-60-4]|nr:MAG: hypothetical protein B7Z55_10065 [Planctomycetales bacterium 12-60-4]
MGDEQLSVNEEQFRFTWDGRNGEAYPHYKRIRDGLFQKWDLLCALHGRRELSIPPVSGWTVRYSNCIPRGTVWTSLADCSFCRLFPRFDEQPGRLAPTVLEGKWQFEAARPQAEFLIECRSSLADGPLRLPCIWIDLECRGCGEGTAEEAACGLDQGRELIVTTFRSLMAPAANAYWGLE